MTFNLQGKQVTQTGAVFTVALRRLIKELGGIKAAYQAMRARTTRHESCVTQDSQNKRTTPMALKSQQPDPSTTRTAELTDGFAANATSYRPRTGAFAHHRGRRRPTEPQSSSSALKALQPEILELRHYRWVSVHNGSK
jgi:hypothetical protein